MANVVQPRPRFELVDVGRFRVAVSADDADISRQIRTQKWYGDEAFETGVFASCVAPGAHVLDIGANIGFYSLLARSRAGAAGRVVAFEPFPESAALLAAGIAANEFNNVHVVQAAVGERNGRVQLHLAPDFWTEHSLHDLWTQPGGASIDVELTTVDAALERLGGGWRADVIKMDIEGGEWNALRGMRRVFAENARLTLFTEFWPGGLKRSGVAPAEFLHWLRDQGFAVAQLDPAAERVVESSIGELEALTARMSEASFPDNPVMQKWGWYTNLLCRRGHAPAGGTPA